MQTGIPVCHRVGLRQADGRKDTFAEKKQHILTLTHLCSSCARSSGLFLSYMHPIMYVYMCMYID